MSGHFDVVVVLASFGVAVLAAYAALFFGAQLSGVHGRKGLWWLLLGGVTMGTGIWTMHFVGMQAHSLSASLSYDLLLTVLSWVAAIAASVLALRIIGLDRVSTGQMALASLLMASGIVVMHYVGMAAMRLSPAPAYHTGFLVLSVVIALAASAGAMVLCRRLREASGGRARISQLGASLLMGAAVAGMHYVGMLAVVIPEGAMPAPANLLAGDWLGLPLALIATVMLTLAVVSAVLDVRLRRQQAEQAERERLRLTELAFVDQDTGLPNRAALEQALLDRMVTAVAGRDRFAVIYLELVSPQALAGAAVAGNGALAPLVAELKLQFSAGCYLARYSQQGFMAVIDNPEANHYRPMYERLRRLNGRLTLAGVALNWRGGQSLFPDTSRSSRMLIRAALKTGSLEQLGRFDAVRPAYAEGIGLADSVA